MGISAGKSGIKLYRFFKELARTFNITLFIFFFVQVPAGAYLALWLFLQFAYQEPGVAWEAHVGGFIVGALLTLPLRSVLLDRVRRLHQPVPRYRILR